MPWTQICRDNDFRFLLVLGDIVGEGTEAKSKPIFEYYMPGLITLICPHINDMSLGALTDLEYLDTWRRHLN